MKAKSILFSFVLLLAMGIFHQCNVDEDIAPITTEQSLFKVVEVADDKNLLEALQKLSVEDTTGSMLPLIFDSYAILSRDLDNNLIHYTLPIYKDLGAGFQNLIITLTPDKKVYPRIFTYQNSDSTFSGMDGFNGKLVISDLYGNPRFFSSIENGNQSPKSIANAKTSVTCTVTTYYTTVTVNGSSTTSIDAVEVSCPGGGGAINLGGANPGDLGIEYGGSGGGSGVAVIPVASGGLGSLIGRLCDNVQFKHHAHQNWTAGAYSATVYGLGVSGYNDIYNKWVNGELGVACITIPAQYLSTTYDAAKALQLAWLAVKQQIFMGLNDGSITPTDYAVRQAFKNRLQNELNYKYPGSKVSASSCSGSIPTTTAQYGC